MEMGIAVRLVLAGNDRRSRCRVNRSVIECQAVLGAVTGLIFYRDYRVG